MKLFGKPIEKLFKSRTEVVKEGLIKPIYTLQDLERVYKEFVDTEDKYSGDFDDVLDLETRGDYEYWNNYSNLPKKLHTEEMEAAENVAAEEDMDMAAIDDIDLRDILGKTQWKKGPEIDNSPAPVIENENPHTAPEDLPVEVEPMVQPERVKPQVKVELEKQEKPMSEVAKFKLMKDVLAYEILVAKNPDLEKFRPMRGDMPLSLDEISATMKAFRTKKEKGQEEISPLEQEFFDHCQAWVGVARKIESFKGKEPKALDGHLLSKQERDVLEKEYFTIKADDKKFAQLSALADLEDVGNKKVESGEWKKEEFAWQEEKGPRGSRWYTIKGMDVYYTFSDPSPVLMGNKSAEFFYTVTQQGVIGKGKKYFVSIKLPKQEAVLA